MIEGLRPGATRSAYEHGEVKDLWRVPGDRPPGRYRFTRIAVGEGQSAPQLTLSVGFQVLPAAG